MPVASFQYIFDSNEANARVGKLQKEIEKLRREIAKLRGEDQKLGKGGGGKGGVFGAPPGAAASFFRTGARGAKEYGNAARGATQAQFQFMSAIQDVAIVMQGGGTFDRAILGAANNFGFLAAMMPGLTGVFATLGVIAIPTVVSAMSEGSTAAREYADALTEIQEAAARARQETVQLADAQKKVNDLQKEVTDLLKEPEQIEAEKKINEEFGNVLRKRLNEDPEFQARLAGEIDDDAKRKFGFAAALSSEGRARTEREQQLSAAVTAAQRAEEKRIAEERAAGEVITPEGEKFRVNKAKQKVRERLQQIQDMVDAGKELKEGTDAEIGFFRAAKNARARQKEVDRLQLKVDEERFKRSKDLFKGDVTGGVGDIETPGLAADLSRVRRDAQTNVAKEFSTESRRAVARRAFEEQRSAIRNKIQDVQGQQVTSGSERFTQQQQVKALQNQLNALNRLLEEFQKSTKNQEELTKFMKQLEGLRGAGVGEFQLQQGEQQSFDEMHPAERALNDAIVAGTGGATPK